MLDEQEIHEMIINNPEKLNFAYEMLNHTEIKILAKELENDAPTKSLDLSNCDLNDEDIKVLTKALEHNTSLTHLNLANNKFSLEGAEAIARTLGKNKSLTHLNLTNNIICTLGAEYIFDALQLNKSLIKLNLANNHIYISIALRGHIIGMAEHNKTLTHLNLSRNELSKIFSGDIIKIFVKESKSLTHLNLDQCLPPKEEYKIKQDIYYDILTRKKFNTPDLDSKGFMNQLIYFSFLLTSIPTTIALTAANFLKIRHPENNPLIPTNRLCKTGIPSIDKELSKKFIYGANMLIRGYFMEEDKYDKLTDNKKIKLLMENIDVIKKVNQMMRSPLARQFCFIFNKLPAEIQVIVAGYIGVDLLQPQQAKYWYKCMDIIKKKPDKFSQAREKIKKNQNPPKTMIFNDLNKQDKGKERDTKEYEVENNNDETTPTTMKMGPM